MDGIRLQVFLAKSGVSSRRKAEELIREGRVTVNGLVADRMGIKVSAIDNIEVDGKKVEFEKTKVYIMFNKPYGVVSTVNDQFSRPSVVDYFKDIDERIYPVGRLDYDTSGLILLTNDGDFTYKLTHPRHNINKVYEACVKGVPTEQEIAEFQRGLEIENYITAPAKLELMRIHGDNSILYVTIREGKNRQVRKMLEKIGHPVIDLKRISIGSLWLGDLPQGEWKHLNEFEISALTND